VCVTGRRDRAGSGIAGSHPLVAGGATDLVAGETGAIHQGTDITVIAGGIRRTAKTILGTAHVGARVLLRDGAVDEATIKAYIENQRWDEDDESFKITAPTKP